jgi:hypothetical protein
MPSFPGLLRNLRYANSNVAERAAQARQAGVQQSGDRVDREYGSVNVYSAPRTAAALLSDEQRAECRRAAEAADRRRLCRRILRHRVLVEFRSGGCRRRRHLREDDMLIHVSIKI